MPREVANSLAQLSADTCLFEPAAAKPDSEALTRAAPCAWKSNECDILQELSRLILRWACGGDSLNMNSKEETLPSTP